MTERHRIGFVGMSDKFVALYRVSTDKQGDSGLGLESQQAIVHRHVESVDGEIVQQFVEVMSGRKAVRPQLQAAIEMCQAYNATLIIKSLDRLSRDAHFLLGLQKSGVKFVACDNPHANELTVGILALVAAEEAKAISQRTKAALQAAKDRGIRLGAYDKDDKTKFVGRVGTAEDVAVAREKRTEKANDKATRLKPILDRVNPDGSLSLGKVAQLLNQEGVPTMSGRGQWNGKSVQRVYQRLAA